MGGWIAGVAHRQKQSAEIFNNFFDCAIQRHLTSTTTHPRGGNFELRICQVKSEWNEYRNLVRLLRERIWAKWTFQKARGEKKIKFCVFPID